MPPAAVKDNVDVIVTDNKQDFHLDSYRQYELDVPTADDFLVCRWSLYRPEVVYSVLQQMVDSYSNPPVSLRAFIENRWLGMAPEFAEPAHYYVVDRWAFRGGALPQYLGPNPGVSSRTSLSGTRTPPSFRKERRPVPRRFPSKRRDGTRKGRGPGGPRPHH